MIFYFLGTRIIWSLTLKIYVVSTPNLFHKDVIIKDNLQHRESSTTNKVHFHQSIFVGFKGCLVGYLKRATVLRILGAERD